MTKRRDKVVGIHLMNTVHLKPVVEVIHGYHTADETLETLDILFKQLDKNAIVVKDFQDLITDIANEEQAQSDLADTQDLKLSIADDDEFPTGNGANGLNKTERKLAKLWKEILGVNEVDKKNDNFFELGDHSLLAILLISSIRKHFQIEIRLDELFDLPAIFDMVNRIKEKLLAEIEQLSDEEVDQILSKELNSKH